MFGGRVGGLSLLPVASLHGIAPLPLATICPADRSCRANGTKTRIVGLVSSQKKKRREREKERERERVGEKETPRMINEEMERSRHTERKKERKKQRTQKPVSHDPAPTSGGHEIGRAHV